MQIILIFKTYEKEDLRSCMSDLLIHCCSVSYEQDLQDSNKEFTVHKLFCMKKNKVKHIFFKDSVFSNILCEIPEVLSYSCIFSILSKKLLLNCFNNSLSILHITLHL